MTSRPSGLPLHGRRTGNTQVATIPGDGERRLAYTEYGDSSGTPVVFLHGTPGSRRLGELFDVAARDHGVRLLAPDRPGYGRSSPWPDRTVRDAGTFVTAVLDDVGVRTAGLVAFSGGSAHALATAATHPGRVSRVDSIAGVTPPDGSEATPMIQRLLSGLATTTPTALRGLFRGQAWLAERLDPSFVVTQYTTGGADGTVPDPVAEVVKADFVEAFARSRSGAVTEFRNTATGWDLPFDGIDVDVRFRHGENDTNVPISGVRSLETRIPTAELRVIDDADHLRTLLWSIPDVLAAHR